MPLAKVEEAEAEVTLRAVVCSPPESVEVPTPVTVSEPRFADAEKRLVDEAVVEKELVVVALVPVAFKKVKFWRVVELFV